MVCFVSYCDEFCFCKWFGFFWQGVKVLSFVLFFACGSFFFARFFLFAKEFVFVSCRWYGFFRKVFFGFAKYVLQEVLFVFFAWLFFCAKGHDLFFCKVSFVLQWVFFCFVALQSVVFLHGFLFVF